MRKLPVANYFKPVIYQAALGANGIGESRIHNAEKKCYANLSPPSGRLEGR